MSMQSDTSNYLLPLLNSYRPANTDDYTTVISTREILTMIFDSTLNDALDGKTIEAKLIEAGFVKMMTGSGEYWLAKNWDLNHS